MMKWVEWVEPGENDKVITRRITAEKAIFMQKASARFVKPDFRYENDQAALDDFITVHWANVIEI
jgi:hypothetical protein